MAVKIPIKKDRKGWEQMASDFSIARRLSCFPHFVVPSLVCKVEKKGESVSAFVQPLAPLGNFNDWMASQSLLEGPDEDQLRLIFKDLAFALKIVHEELKEVLFGDVKPSNVLLFTESDGNISAKISDARFLATDFVSPTKLKLACSPRELQQQAEQSSHADLKFTKYSNVYSLGKLLSFFWQHFKESVPYKWTRIIESCCKKNPPISLDELLQLLQDEN